MADFTSPLSYAHHLIRYIKDDRMIAAHINREFPGKKWTKEDVEKLRRLAPRPRRNSLVDKEEPSDARGPDEEGARLGSDALARALERYFTKP